MCLAPCMCMRPVLFVRVHVRVHMHVRVCTVYGRYSTFDAHRGRVWVEDHKQIVRHYLFGWFLVDVVSTLVSAFDIIALYLDQNAIAQADALLAAAAASESEPFTSESPADATRAVKIIKLVRALRLVKLLRLLRGSRIFRRVETKMTIKSSSTIRTVQLLDEIPHFLNFSSHI